MHSSLTTRGGRASARRRNAAATRTAQRAPARAGPSDPFVTLADQRMRTGCPAASPQRWNSRDWQDIRRAAYRTLLDMTVFPALSREGVPMPNALRANAVQHGLIDAATGQPTERLLRLNPSLRRSSVPM